jgi:hypothetical protein
LNDRFWHILGCQYGFFLLCCLRCSSVWLSALKAPYSAPILGLSHLLLSGILHVTRKRE